MLQEESGSVSFKQSYYTVEDSNKSCLAFLWKIEQIQFPQHLLISYLFQLPPHLCGCPWTCSSLPKAGCSLEAPDWKQFSSCQGQGNYLCSQPPVDVQISTAQLLLCFCRGLFYSRCIALHFPVLKFIRFLLGHFSSLSSSTLLGALLCSKSSTLHVRCPPAWYLSLTCWGCSFSLHLYC